MLNITSGQDFDTNRMIEYMSIVGDLWRRLREAGVKYNIKLDVEESSLLYAIIEVISDSDEVDLFANTILCSDDCIYRKLSDDQYYFRIKFAIASAQ